MARLPQPGGDKGSWGDVLNDYLSQTLTSDGNLKSGVVGDSQLTDGAVTEVKLSPAVQTKLNDGGTVADNSISTIKLQDDSVTAAKIAPGAVTKADVGLSNVDNTSDLNKSISTATQTALDAKQATATLAADVASHVTDSSALDTALTARYVQKPTLVGKTLIAHTHSWGDPAVMVPGQTPTAAGLYYNRVATALGGNPPQFYGKGGMRIDFGVSSLVAAGALPGHPAPLAGSVWPGVSNRPGPVICDFLMNDYAHSNGVSITPQPITGAGGDRYVAGIAAAYEAFFAIVSSESRREISSGGSGVTFNGAGWATFPADYLSGGDFSWTNGAGDYVTVANIIPPQTGVYAGKVFIGIDVFDQAVLPMTNADVSIDGGTATTWTNPGWEAYGAGGAANQVYATISAALPADTGGHSVRLTHSGSAGQYIIPDALYIPSVNPPEIYVMDTPDPVANSGGWSAADVAVWRANRDILRPVIKAAAAKYPNVVWVPTTMTPGVLWVDGIHPNDAGLAQRAVDLEAAIGVVDLLGVTAAKHILAA